MKDETVFPLTEMQEAFYVGRRLGSGGGTQVHLEFEVDDLDLAQMEEAWNRLVHHHDMLRATVLPDARQAVHADVPRYNLSAIDLSGLPEDAQAAEIDRLRRDTADGGFDPAVWPLFAIRVAWLGHGRARVFFAVDEMVADGPSVSILMQQWYETYRDGPAPAPLGLSFQDYLNRTAAPDTVRSAALQYWRDKLAQAPLDRPAPFTMAPSGDDRPRRTLSMTLSAPDWATVQHAAREGKATPSALLLALYTAAASDAELPVVLTTYNRRLVHPDVARLVGPFISTTIFLAPPPHGTLRGRLGSVQRQLWQDLEHAAVSGVQAQREWARRTRGSGTRAIPVVFNSMLGSLVQTGPDIDPKSWAALVDEGLTGIHTPGVHLEQCVRERANGDLVLTWDVATEVLDVTEAERAFARLSAALRRIAANGSDALDTELLGGGQAGDIANLPLTDIQSSFLVGRLGGLPGAAETRVYQEFLLHQHDLDRLEAAWNRLIAHHPMLRGVVHAAGSLTLRGQVPYYPISRHDLSALALNAAERRLAETAERMLATRFELDRWPMFALEASLRPDGKIVLHAAVDALLADARSLAMLFRQLFVLHDGREGVLGAGADRLADHLRERATPSEGAQAAAAEWAERFASLPPGPPLKDTGPRTHRRFEVDSWSRLKHRADRVGVPADMLLLTAYVDTLREAFATAFTIVVVSWDRPETVEEVVGDFTGLAWLVVDDALPASFEDRAREIWARVKADLDRGSAKPGLAQLRQRVFRSKGALRLPVVFTRVPELPKTLEIAGVDMLQSQSQTAQVALDHVPVLVGDRLVCQWDAARDALPADRLDVLFSDYERRVRDCLDDTAWTLAQHLTPSFAKHADKPAIHWNGRTITYAELDRRTARLANHLIRHGCRPGERVAVHMDRSDELVVALVAIVRAGGVFVPVDPVNPPDRVRFLIEDSEARLAVADADHAATAEATGAHVICPDRDAARLDAEPQTAPAVEVAPDDPIYMIYTSGTTGLPKGCPNSQRGVTNRIVWMQTRFPLTTADRVLQKTPYGFDVSAWEFFWPLMAGAAIVVARPGGHMDTGYLARLIRAEAVSVLHFVPSVLGMFLREPSAAGCSGLRYVFVSGEALPVATMRRFYEVLPETELHNLYGPTEAAIDVTHWPCRADWDEASVPIGRPIANTTIHIVDESLKEVPPGTSGEICIAGYGVALGYHNRPELTRERFVSTPYAERLYRTGDLGLVADDGELRYLGRIDNQFKIRGLRIEPEEIEAALVSWAGLADARVLPVPGEDDEQILAAVCIATGTPPSIPAIRQALSDALPPYMVPSQYRFVDMLPLTQNGKLDRDNATALFQRTDAAPGPTGDDLTATIRSIVTAALGHDELAPDANLFDLGATSFTAIRIAQEIENHTGIALPVDAFIDTPTVTGLVAALGGAIGFGEGAGDGAEAAVATPAERHDTLDPARIANAAAEIMGIDTLDEDANLFDLGATSFTMIRLAQTLADRHGAEVPVDLLIDRPTPRGIAAGLQDNARSTTPPQRRADLRIAFDPEAKKAFQKARIAERRLPEELPRVPLAGPAAHEPLGFFDASSFRAYARDPLPADSLLDLLNLVTEGELAGRRKRRYPSAGGFYPVQTYVYVRHGRVEGLEGGLYFLHPRERVLIRIDPDLSVSGDTQARHNRDHVHDAAFAVFLVSTPAAIAPAYGERLGVKYSTIEGGHMAQVLMTAAPVRGLGLCPVGDMDFASIRPRFRLDDDQELLISIWGGALNGEDATRRAALTDAPESQPASAHTDPSTDRCQQVAVVGFSAHLPGADTLDTLTELLASGGTAIGRVPGHRWKPLQPRARRGGVEVGGYLGEVDLCEAEEFRLTDAEAAAADPQERLLLTTVRRCLEDAALTRERLATSGPVGVYVGAMWADHALYGVSARAAGERGTHATRGGLAHRISHAFDLIGPSLVLDSGCVSGLASVDAAIHAIRSGQCTAAIAAASNLVLHPDHLDVLAELGLVAEESDSCAFTDQACGWIVGEGVGAVLLKPLDAALADGDPIHAVIRGSAVRHSGATRQYGLPSHQRQEETMRAALADARLAPEAIGYVEAAASGAALADSLEIAGLSRVFAGGEPVRVGSVKPVVGHLEAASVFAQLAKVIAQFRSGRIFATRLTSDPNPTVISAEGVTLARETVDWPRRTDGSGIAGRRALIDGFAGTGSYGCLVVEEPPLRPALAQDTAPHVLPLSADTPENLAAYAEALADAVDGKALASVARSLREGRAPRAARAVATVTAADAGARLRDLAQTIRIGGKRSVGTAPPEAAPLVAAWLAGDAVRWPEISSDVPRASLPSTPLRVRRFWPPAGPKPPTERPDDTAPMGRLRKIVTSETGISPTELSPATDLLALGVTSRQLQRIAARVSSDGGKAIPLEALFETDNLADLAAAAFGETA